MALNLSAPIFQQFANNDNFNTYGGMAVAAANNAGIDPNVFVSLIGSESSFSPTAYNKSGAAGIAQFMPTTAAENGINPFDPAQSLTGAAEYLSTLKDKYGNYQDAVAAYKGSVNSDVAQSEASKVLADAGLSNSDNSVKSASFVDDLMKAFGGTGIGENPVNDALGDQTGKALNGTLPKTPGDIGVGGKSLWDSIVAWFGAHAYMAIFIVIGIVAVVFSVRNAFTPAKAA